MTPMFTPSLGKQQIADAASYVTGAALTGDGGWSVH